MGSWWNVDIGKGLLGNYAPIVNWLSVRTQVTISMLNDLEDRSINSTLAFHQTKLGVNIYIELPARFDNGGCARNYSVI